SDGTLEKRPSLVGHERKVWHVDVRAPYRDHRDDFLLLRQLPREAALHLSLCADQRRGIRRNRRAVLAVGEQRQRDVPCTQARLSQLQPELLSVAGRSLDGLVERRVVEADAVERVPSYE